MKIAYLIRNEYGVLGGADSYMFPATVAKTQDVMVLESKAPESKGREEIVFSCPDVALHNIYAQKINDRIANAHSALFAFDPDVVHVFQSAACLRFIYALRRSFPGAKWVLDFRTPLLVPGGRAAMRRRRRDYFFAQFFVDRILTHSLGTLGSNLPLRFRGVTEVPPGVALEMFEPGRPELREPSRFVFVGSLAKVRDVGFMVRAFGEAAGRVSRPITLDVYGAGDDEDHLRALAGELGLEGTVVFKGVLPQEELFRVLPGYDVGVAYVPLDRKNRVFANAPSLKSLEYAAAGIEVLASATPGHKEHCRRHGFDFCFFRNTRADFAAGVEALCSRGLDEARLEKNAAAVAGMDWQAIVDGTLLPCYERLLAQ